MIRRDFLKLSVAAAPGMALVLHACHSPAGTAQEALAQPESLFGIMDKTELQAIGKAFLAATPTTKDALQTQILGKPVTNGTPLTELSNQIAATVKQDFSAGRTIVLNGWVLSLTEARQCALHTLLYQ